MPTLQPPSSQHLRGALLGLGSAALFGLSAPLAKLLLGSVSPILLAGLLYLGAAGGLWFYRALGPGSREAHLQRQDLPKLATLILAGGVAAPVFMLFGLQRVTALTGSLLLNLEAPLTVLMAVIIFHEHLGRHAAAATACILGGALVLQLASGKLGADAVGVCLLAAACLCWALDNNLTQRLSLRDPFAIVRRKTLVAGVVNTGLGLFVAHGQLPPPSFLCGALALGCVSYGISVVLDAYALRAIGAAREAAYFATAPFVGAIASVALFGDSLGVFDVVAMGFMALGVGILVRERHCHRHVHERLDHEHLHEHDDHHHHQHGPGDPPGAPHNHRHIHPPQVHDHSHVPDAHHRHKH